MTNLALHRLRATWYNAQTHREMIDNEYFYDEPLCHFIAGDWGIRDYLVMVSDSVLLSPPFFRLTKTIYQFTSKLVEEGVAKWEDDKQYGNVELYKNGYDPAKWAPCCVAAMVEPLYQEWAINSKYAVDLFAIYKLGLRTIHDLGFDYSDLNILHGMGLNSGTKISELYLYYKKYGDLNGWPETKDHKNEEILMSTFMYLQQYHVDWYSDRSIMKKCKKLDAEKGCTKYTTSLRAPRVFCDDYAAALNKACRAAKIKPFEKRGFVAKVSPAIIQELIEKYKKKYPPEFRSVIRNLIRDSYLLELVGMTLDDVLSPEEAKQLSAANRLRPKFRMLETDRQSIIEILDQLSKIIDRIFTITAENKDDIPNITNKLESDDLIDRVFGCSWKMIDDGMPEWFNEIGQNLAELKRVNQTLSFYRHRYQHYSKLNELYQKALILIPKMFIDQDEDGYRVFNEVDDYIELLEVCSQSMKEGKYDRTWNNQEINERDASRT